MSPRSKPDSTKCSRRRFLKATAAAAGAGLAVGPYVLRAGPSPSSDIRVGVIGAGTQGRVLIQNCLKIPGVRFAAIADIWPYSQRYASRRLQAYNQPVTPYEDYREMLDKEKDLDAVIVATPDWVHAEHAIAALEAGKHVYCEKEMSNSLQQARAMVLAARRTGKLLQIGHQRRSNPRYRHAADKLLAEAKLLGRVTAVYGQWNRAKQPDLGWPKEYELDAAALQKYGYASMHEFVNWRWFRKYGGGPIEDLGSHQIDIYNWFLGARPTSVVASGGMDYYKGHEWYDNVMAIYEFQTPAGVVRAFYQVQTTTSARGYYETFMGDEGTLQISEDPAKCRVYAEGSLPPDAWDAWAKKGYILRMPLAEEEAPAQSETDAIVSVYKSAPQVTWLLPVEVETSYHQPHLENFFGAIRDGTPLTCPADVAYETAVTVLTVNQAVEAGGRVDFKAEDFTV